MIGIIKENVNSIPSLVVVDSNKKKEALPMITYFHGFTSAKEHNLDIAFLLAEKGFRVVLPDSKMHGERDTTTSIIQRTIGFWDIVMQNVKELSEIRDYYEQKKLILDGRFGVAGTSMGGITTSAALTQYPWIKTAAVLMGSPRITTFAKQLINNYKKVMDLPVTDVMIENLYVQLEHYDLSTQIEKLNQRPVLFWHGDKDQVVPFDHSYSFYEEARKLYDKQENIKFIKEINCDHKVSRHAILETIKWFEQHL
ncbi:esterase [Oceanobacillus sp. 143]|uniref:Esterase n=1 Tax=Oceanobacillus zhaokaii TaxID=2052660 RepID=A0A345PFJ3_9BACI|nr:esterase [Oceanobacillus zhaokaii]AXI08773.1 esterase [Oceanobacillus zhaokaii]QGS68487.1 esterase [Oceanobacillus sp. 143]